MIDRNAKKNKRWNGPLRQTYIGFEVLALDPINLNCKFCSSRKFLIKQDISTQMVPLNQQAFSPDAVKWFFAKSTMTVRKETFSDQQLRMLAMCLVMYLPEDRPFLLEIWLACVRIFSMVQETLFLQTIFCFMYSILNKINFRKCMGRFW